MHSLGASTFNVILNTNIFTFLAPEHLITERCAVQYLRTHLCFRRYCGTVIGWPWRMEGDTARRAEKEVQEGAGQ